MNFHEIKFSFDTAVFEKKRLDEIFSAIDSFLGLRLDEDLNIYSAKNDDIYDFKDFSNSNQEDFDLQADSFFNFNFNEIIDVQLYRFLVLRKSDKLRILANIPHLFLIIVQ